VASESVTLWGRFLGRSIERVEDAALLTGRGRFGDDLPVRADTLHAAFLRSPHAHADLGVIDVSDALAMKGVEAVVTGEDAKAHTKPFVAGLKQPIKHYCVAVERVRYVGEPVAIVVAKDRYIAEDALEKIHVTYQPLSAVVDVEKSITSAAPVLHEAVGSNLLSDRTFIYGAPDEAFLDSDHRVNITVRYPRNSCTPIECFVVVAEYDPAKGGYDVLANFQGPFTLHSVMALALGVPANRLRLRTPPDSGGSFGVKQAVFPYVVAMALASRLVCRPVKWVEDRLEHLLAANAATGRVTRIEAAVNNEGEIIAFDIDQLEDCGAYLRAPEPASLYRMHGNLSGAYKLRHIRVRNRVALTNTVPSGLNRGFGGPQLYYAIERLMDRIAVRLRMDPIELRKRNFVLAEQFPYRCPAGALLDSGDYQRSVDLAVTDGKWQELLRRRDQARAEGRLYGIGCAAVVESSMSNMGYITTVLDAEERARVGPKNGALTIVTVTLDPLGSVSVVIDSLPQGQGHQTAIAQVIAEVLGILPEEVAIESGFDSGVAGWSIAAGNYSSRFAPAVAGTAYLAASRLRDRLSRLACQHLNVATEKLEFADGKIFSSDNPANSVPFRRIAGSSHWSPGTLPEGLEPVVRETATWTPPQLEAPDASDRINGATAYGFIFDFCGVEVDRVTHHIRIDHYVTMHDAGRRINPALLDGQIRGAFAHGIGAALFERFRYDDDGQFLSGTFADYLVPTACEVPDPIILHTESPSPFTPLGTKGAGEGQSMSTPVCIANAVADALGVDDIELPLTPDRVAALMSDDEPSFRSAGAK